MNKTSVENTNFDELDYKDLTDQLYGNMIGGVVITALAYFALVILFQGLTPQWMIFGLELAMWAIVIARFIDWFYWHKRPPTLENASSYKLRFKILALLTGICWAVAACTLFPYQTLEERYFMLLALGSMTGGAVIVLSGSRILSISYPSLLILPISAMSFFSGVYSLEIVGVLGIGYWLMMLNVGQRASKNTRQTIHFKNQQLAMRKQMENERNELATAYKQLSIANANLDAVNADLENKVEERTSEIYRLSNLDPLTGLLNRTALLKQLQSYIDADSEQAIAVLFVDLNGFKAINDSLGHHIGDQVLTEIASRLEKYSEQNSICRWGGDEFVVLASHQSFNATLAFVKSLLKDISEAIVIDGNVLQIDACIGVSLYPEHDETATGLIEKADVAMYKNKREIGAGMLFYDQQLKAELVKEQVLLTGLKQAMARTQLYLVYQPIIDAKTRKPWGVEALIRWNFDSNLIRPDEFIPLAEKTGVILDIGQWVLIEACSQHTKWQHAADSELSVNVSAVQLSSANFPAVVEKALIVSGLAPSKLHLEITETAIMDYESDVLNTIHTIRKLGVKVSIDDFGTGYSSLSQLKSVPANTLKIDRAFVTDVAEDNDVMVRAALLIAFEYKYQTVAEGIETPDQARYLLQAGVDLFQGYLFSKPLGADELDGWWQDNQNGVDCFSAESETYSI